MSHYPESYDAIYEKAQGKQDTPRDPTMVDIHGNVVRVRDIIYIVAAAAMGSKSTRLLLGVVQSIAGNSCQVKVLENNRIYRKTSATIVKPENGGQGHLAPPPTRTLRPH